MERVSRRGFLATAAAALSAGCSVTDEESAETVTPHEVPSVVGRRTPTPTPECPPDCEQLPDPEMGPDPLGYSAVPEGVAARPALASQHVYDADGAIADRDRTTDTDRPTATGAYPERETHATGLTVRSEGIDLLVRTQRDGVDGPPHLIRGGPGGRPVSRWRLTDLPSPFARFLARAANVLVVGGPTLTSGGRREWLRGFIDEEPRFEYWTDTSSELRTVTGFRQDLLLGETLYARPGRRDPVGGDVVRIGRDGAVRWRRRLSPPGGTGRLLRVDGGTHGILATGVDDERIWLVALDTLGRDRWRATVPRGPGAYEVVDVAAGPTGTYLQAAPGDARADRDHVLVASLDDRGGVEWVRLFDPAVDGDGVTAIAAGGILDVNGPVVAGNVEGPAWWLSSLAPDGTVRSAGYHRRTVGGWGIGRARLQLVYGRPAVYGAALAPETLDVTPRRRPWFALL